MNAETLSRLQKWADSLASDVEIMEREPGRCRSILPFWIQRRDDLRAALDELRRLGVTDG